MNQHYEYLNELLRANLQNRFVLLGETNWKWSGDTRYPERWLCPWSFINEIYSPENIQPVKIPNLMLRGNLRKLDATFNNKISKNWLHFVEI